MLKSIKSILFVICIVMVFTAQANRPDDKQKGQQHAPAARPAARPAPAAHNNQSRPPAQTRRVAPIEVVHRAPPTPQAHRPQPSQEGRPGPRVYAVPAPAPVANNRLFNRQHHNQWQPLYNFYNNQYQFYPYVNVTSPVELSPNCVPVGFNGQTYYYDLGRFYQQDGQGQYFAVPPPIGIIVNVLPPHARQIMVNDQVFYRYKGIFYVQTAQGYQVVGPVQPDPGSS